MNVNVPAVAPTTPPDIGASTNWPWPDDLTDVATSRDVVGSIVEQSMNSRLEFEIFEVDSAGSMICEKTFRTCDGSGKTVIVVSYRTMCQR